MLIEIWRQCLEMRDEKLEALNREASELKLKISENVASLPEATR